MNGNLSQHCPPRQTPLLLSNDDSGVYKGVCLAPYLRVLGLQSFLPIPRPAPLGEVVDRGELDEGGEDKGVADGDEPVHGRGVGHLREGVPGADAERGHGEHGGHACGGTEGSSYSCSGEKRLKGNEPLTENRPRRNRFSVEPKGHLGQDDGHETGHVRLDDEISNLPLQVEVGHHHRVLA